MKKSKLYLPSGYLNYDSIIKLPVAFIIIIGGRAIGKTYGALKYVVEHDIKFIFVRRTQTQIDEIATKSLNPFKALNEDMEWNIYPKPASKNTYDFIDATQAELKIIGKVIALSTFANIRGFDASDCDVLIFDEFIPELHQKAMRGEAEAIFNMIETINRNRELQGRKSLKCIFLSNSTACDNPLFIELGIVTLTMNLSKKGEFFYENVDRSLSIIMPKESPISEQKKNTSLYKLTKGTSFYASSIGNEFVNNNESSVISRPLREYKPLVIVGELCIYKHKNKNLLYVSGHKSGNVDTYSSSAKELSIFRKRYSRLQVYVIRGMIDYESYACEVLFDRYFDLW